MVCTTGRGRHGTAATVNSTPLLTKVEACHNCYLRKHLLLMQRLLYYYGNQLASIFLFFLGCDFDEKELAKGKRKIRKEKIDAKRALQHRLLFDKAISLQSSSDDSSDEDEMPRFTDVEVEHSICKIQFVILTNKSKFNCLLWPLIIDC
ncbi:hypothetical protein MKX03_013530 [Papaver bracteatum]|nr:hypothetical protein MKX03_013530 [Papaver bracteatum]